MRVKELVRVGVKAREEGAMLTSMERSDVRDGQGRREAVEAVDREGSDRGRDFFLLWLLLVDSKIQTSDEF